MEWTPERIQVEVDRRHEDARHSALVRELRRARGTRPAWWRRLRSHPESVDDRADSELAQGERPAA